VQSISYNGGGLSYTQSFGYDGLNRLTTSQENSGSSWSQTNGYDRYGNRWIDLGGGNQSLYFSTSSNRISSSGFSYDAAGNLTNDTVHAYSFDAENKIVKVDNVSAYVYDGEGQRVRKLIGENLRFVYDMQGKEVAEFDGSNGNLRKNISIVRVAWSRQLNRPQSIPTVRATPRRTLLARPRRFQLQCWRR
jgi:hypothetical protein